MPEPITLLEEESPSAPVMAVVETDGSTVYLYLHGPPHTSFGTRALWIANLAPAPEAIDVERLRRGEPPMMPAKSTRSPDGLKLKQLEPLRLVWFPEGTGVALLGQDGLLGVLPPGANDSEGFPGFARECTQKNKLAWALDGEEGASARKQVEAADGFWKRWDEQDPWPGLRERLVGAIDTALGKNGVTVAADNGEWPPRVIAVRHTPAATVVVTGGASIRPQPGVARASGTSIGPRRVELAMAMRGEASEPLIQALASYLAGQCQLPWLRLSWLGHGHTLACEVLAATSGARFTAVVCLENPAGAPQIPFPDYEGDPVRVLWLVPITAAEREIAVKQGSRALVERLAKLGEVWAHHDRADLGVSN